MKPEKLIWNEWDIIDDTLGGDVLKLEEAIAIEDSSTLRRSYCRAIFAYIEGVAGWMKRYTILFYHPGTLGVDEKVTLERRDGAMLFLFNALDLFADTAGAATPLKRGAVEWTVVQRGIKIRNRITHPSSAADVTISDSDFAQLRAVRELFTDLVYTVLRDSAAAHLRNLALVEKKRLEVKKTSSASG